MSAHVPDRLLRPDETANRLGCTRRTLEKRIALGDAPPSIRLGRLRRFPESALNDWIAGKLAAAGTNPS
jgi:excisionase family DNA binding protein